MPALQFATGVQPVLSQSACSAPLFDERARRSAGTGSASTAFLLEGLRPVQAVLQYIYQIKYVGWRWGGWCFCSCFLVLCVILYCFLFLHSVFHVKIYSYF